MEQDIHSSRGIPAREQRGEQASGKLLEEGQEGKEGRHQGGSWKYRMDKRGNSRKPFDEVSLNVGTLQ